MSDENSLAASETAAPEDENKAPTVEKAAEVDTEAKTDSPDTDAAKSDDDVKEDKPKPKSRAQERIEQLARDKRNLQKALARANQEVGKLRATPPPREEDYEDVAEYTRAQIKRAAKESAVESQTESLNSEYEGLQAKRQEVWAERVAEARERIPDFDSIFDGNVPVSQPMADLIAESDVGIELALYLGQNRSVAHRIAEMSPFEAAREIGRLEGRVSHPKAKTVSTAPKPVSTVTGKAHAPAKTLEDMSYEDYRKTRMAQERAKLGR
jgi:hypothetical protein